MAEREPFSKPVPPKAPEPMHETTGDLWKIEDARKKFFDETLDYLGIVSRAREYFTSVVFKGLSVDEYYGYSPDIHFGEEEYAAILKIRDLPLASMISIRDDGNYLLGHFAQYLTPDYEQKIKELFAYRIPSVIEIEHALSEFRNKQNNLQ